MKLRRWTAIFLSSILLNINKHEIAACGQLQQLPDILPSRITFGHDTHHWPWHAAIYHQNYKNEFKYHCGGTLASPKFVLTAAHCVSVTADLVSVSLGRLHLNASQSSAPFIKVAEILTHPNYREENYVNDIAIITLATDVIFNSYIQPVCMWSGKTDLSELIGKFGTVVGWGVTENGETSNALQEVSLPVVSSFTCLESNRDFFGQLLSAENFCAVPLQIQVSAKAIVGSMTFQKDGRFYIRGIVSVGATKLVDRSSNIFECDSVQYAIFTDVAQYLQWIREKIERKTVVPVVPTVQCDKRLPNFACTAILTIGVEDSGCNQIFDENSSVSGKELSITGDWTSAVPDLSCAVDKFMKLEKLLLHDFTHVDRSTLSPFKNIRELSVQRFIFTQFDGDTFVDLNNLESVSIDFGNLETLPAGIFRNNNKIRILFLYGNVLHELRSDVFENLRNIEQLSIDENRLDTLPANIFRNNEKMTTIHLRLNSIKKVHEDLFNGLTNLEELDLSDNRIEHLPSGLFRSNTKLAFVLLSNNAIKRVDVDLTTMPQLVILTLEKNDCIDENFDFPKQSLSKANEKIQRACTT